MKTFILFVPLMLTACNGCSGVTISPNPPSPTGSPVATPQPTIPLSDAGPCSVACVQAQDLCSHPASVNQCIIDCQRAVSNLENVTPYCVALLSTCGKSCQES